MGDACSKIDMQMKIFLMGLTLAVVASFAAPDVVLAQGTAACSNNPLSGVFCGSSLREMLNSAFQISILIGAVLAMLRIGFAGWLYMGSDIWGDKTKAKEVFQDAIIGLLILLAIYMILYQINPDILKLEGLPGN